MLVAHKGRDNTERERRFYDMRLLEIVRNVRKRFIGADGKDLSDRKVRRRRYHLRVGKYDGEDHE